MFTITKKELDSKLKPMKFTNKSVISLEAKEGILTIYSLHELLELQINCNFEGEVKFCTNYFELSRAIKPFSTKESLIFSTDGERVTVGNGVFSNSFECWINDYVPTTFTAKKELMPKDKFAIKSCAYAMANLDVRYYLNSMLLEELENGELAFTATDGHRMATNANYCDKVLRQIIIPNHTIESLLGFMDDDNQRIYHSFDGKQGAFFIESENLKATIEYKAVDGRYPDYKRLPLYHQTGPGFTIRKDSAEKILDFCSYVIKSKKDKYLAVLFEFNKNKELKLTYKENSLIVPFDCGENVLNMLNCADMLTKNSVLKTAFNAVYIKDTLFNAHIINDIITLCILERGELVTSQGVSQIVMPVNL